MRRSMLTTEQVRSLGMNLEWRLNMNRWEDKARSRVRFKQGKAPMLLAENKAHSGIRLKQDKVLISFYITCVKYICNLNSLTVHCQLYIRFLMFLICLSLFSSVFLFSNILNIIVLLRSAHFLFSNSLLLILSTCRVQQLEKDMSMSSCSKYLFSFQVIIR
jgi:hypothetical protein